MIHSLLFSLTVLFVSSAHAALLLEPYGGYSVGSISATPVGGGPDLSASVNGGGYGGRAGFLIDHFFILAYDHQILNATEKEMNTTGSFGWKQTTQYVTAGLQLPFGLRILGSYGFHFDAEEATTPDVTKYDGKAYKLAVGWMLTSEIAVNAEYSVFQFENKTINGVASKMNTLFSKYNSSATFVNISIPFSFFHWGSGGGARRREMPGPGGGGPGGAGPPP